MLKLPDGSRARRLLAGHVTRSAAKVIVSEERRWDKRVERKFALVSATAAVIGIALDVAMGGSEHTSIGEYARTQAPTLSKTFIAWALIFLATSMFYMWRRVRRRGRLLSKKAGHRDENEEPETAQEEGDDDDAPSGADGQGD